MFKNKPILNLAKMSAVLIIGLVLVAAGCSKKKEAPKVQTSAANPHDNMRNPKATMGIPQVATDDNPFPLKLKGINSVEELNKYLGRIKNKKLKSEFAKDFRLCFTENRNIRDYAAARDDLLNFVKKMPNFAPAYRLLGYTEFNLGFNVSKSIDYYNKALRIDPNYGEVQYALAFMYVMIDLQKGLVHFKKAMALGVPDEHNLGPKYYDVPIKK